MSIRIEITGENTQEIAQSILQMAFMIAPRLAAAPQAAAVEPAVETVQPTKKPARTKKGDAPTIEHDESEVKTDVREPAVSEQPEQSAGDAAASAAGAPANDDAGGAVEESAKDEAAAEVDAVAEPVLTIDELRAFTVNSYLNVVFDKLEERKAAYGALLDQFEVKAITGVPAARINEFKAVVDAKIAEALVGK